MASFALTALEGTNLSNWLKTHRCNKSQTIETCDSLMTSNYEVCFRPSGVGPSVAIRCDCGHNEDITDWDSA